MQTQPQTPCKITVAEIEKIYDRAFAKLKTMKGGSEFYDYAILCQRILNWKLSKIYASHEVI